MEHIWLEQLLNITTVISRGFKFYGQVVMAQCSSTMEIWIAVVLFVYLRLWQSASGQLTGALFIYLDLMNISADMTGYVVKAYAVACVSEAHKMVIMHAAFKMSLLFLMQVSISP